MQPIPISVPSIDRDELINQHLHLVHKIAVKFQRPHGQSIEDLRGAGVLGLVAAADRERAKGYPKGPEYFTAYAISCIRGAILDSLDARKSGLSILSKRGGIVDSLQTRRSGLAIVGAEESVPDSTAGRYEFQEALESLPEMEREILLRRLEGYTRAEIAQSIQMSDWKVREYENRAISLLQKREGVALRRAA